MTFTNILGITIRLYNITNIPWVIEVINECFGIHLSYIGHILIDKFIKSHHLTPNVFHKRP